MTSPRIFPPVGSPQWMADYNQSVERELRALSEKGFTLTATGTGASQDVALPKAGLLASDVLVFVSGALVTSGYTITGRTLTITAASSAPVAIIER